MIFDGIEKEVIPAGSEKESGDVAIYQHKRSGRVQELYASVGEEYVEMAKGMILETEILTTGEIALYAHWPDEEDYGCELVINGPGDSSPTEKLKVAIKSAIQRAGQ